MSVRAGARHLGVRLHALQQAIARGRVRDSIVVNEKGQPKIADLAALEREWHGSASRLPPQAYREQHADLRGVAKRVVALVAEVQADTLEVIARTHVPAALEGARAQLRADAVDASPSGLAAALALDEGLDGPALELACRLLEAGREGQGEDEAREAGREAVRQVQEVDDGDEG